ncbi:MAG: glycosyltransferase [Firmicutes bacterium]|nr:glycosyltransferase [Bacillota bacterium]
MSTQIRVAFVSTYPPRQCGIATFTRDLRLGLQEVYEQHGAAHTNLQVVAIDSSHYKYDYPPEVHLTIHEQKRADYREAADLINLSPIDVVLLQHEYGIFGGEDGNHVIHLLSALKKPIVTTLHNVLEKPSPGQRETLKTICALSTFVVVQAERAVEMLARVFDVPRRKIVMIHHGAPDVPFLDPAYFKDECGAEGRPLVFTFGLLSPNKGIEYAIRSVSTVVRQFPDVMYIVLGVTHPEVRRRFGDVYRLSLEQLVREKGLEGNVSFHDRFVTNEQLVKFLVASDVYVTPYLSKEQITSGTLSYAMACGKAIVSTPYWHAEELLSEGRGMLVPFRNSDALAEKLVMLLGNQNLRDRIRKQAYQYGRQMIWPQVAARYLAVFQNAVAEYAAMASDVTWVTASGPSPLLDINLNHLKTLTDDVGLLQHAFFTTPDRIHGYCTDDNARALIATIMNWHLLNEESVLALMQVYLAFVNHAIDWHTGSVRNFMSYERRWLEEAGSEDCHGRTAWALGHCVALAPNDSILGLSTRLFNRILGRCSTMTSPRACAHLVLGCLEYLKRFGGDRDAREVAYSHARRLHEMLQANTTAGWHWFEDIVAYDNARLSQALIVAGNRFADQALLQAGLTSLEWLLELQSDPNDGHLSPVGTAGWYQKGKERARFDQQPIEVSALVDACYEAYFATDDERWLENMQRCFDWFMGRNDVREVLYDFASGGCHDGLHPSGVNGNEGAESTVSWLMALHRMHQVQHQKLIRQAATPEADREAAAN